MSTPADGLEPAREATEAELADWDRRTVDVAGGQVLQSLAWARHRAASGWQAHFLACGGGRVLALTRPWPVIGGARAYLPRGPVTAGDAPAEVAARLAAVAAWLEARGVDMVTSDAELPVDSGYAELLAEQGFRPVEELQPARHRMSLRLDGESEEEILAGVSKQTRQRIRRAEEDGLLVRRFDARAATGPSSGLATGPSTDPGPGFATRPSTDPGPGFATGPAEDLESALATFHRLVRSTGERRGFQLGPIRPFLTWLTAAHAAGHAIYLEALAGSGAGEVTSPAIEGLAPVSPAGRIVAGLLLYRQGDRLSTVISGDDVAARVTHPGALHLLRWRAIQLASREGRAEMDLGGVDVAGARHEPRPGEAMYGLYQHKRSFGAVFVEQVGAHERVFRAAHLVVARAAARLAGGLRG